ncbi:MAG: small basic protein [Candidatus Omnitrophica bacterium]|nr:small basic protein [Candidatus Omnitrophota bacterium]MBI2495703.1 small basic protein [Candidatus Omnitrophota bacterium]MBI3021992.1 small basic protein [Candidatus Omnitrophota bacterium]MBI3082892.1 small basic protein [Candidatus Omnitrophota bacterium]
MSIHTSLRSSGRAAASARNVLKRHERVRALLSRGLWAEGRSVFGLPKVKQMKMKTRKAAAKEKEETPAAPSPS